MRLLSHKWDIISNTTIFIGCMVSYCSMFEISLFEFYEFSFSMFHLAMPSLLFNINASFHWFCSLIFTSIYFYPSFFGTPPQKKNFSKTIFVSSASQLRSWPWLDLQYFTASNRIYFPVLGSFSLSIYFDKILCPGWRNAVQLNDTTKIQADFCFVLNSLYWTLQFFVNAGNNPLVWVCMCLLSAWDWLLTLSMALPTSHLITNLAWEIRFSPLASAPKESDFLSTTLAHLVCNR